MRKTKPAEAPLYQPGDVFTVALPSGWFSAVRILRREERSGSQQWYLIATTTYLDRVAPRIDDPRLTKVLMRQRFAFDGQPALFWLDGEQPETLSFLGNRPVSEEEAAPDNNDAPPERRSENDRQALESEVSRRSAETREEIERQLRKSKKPKKMLADDDFWGLIALVDPPTDDGFDPESGTERLIAALARRTRADIKRFDETLSYKVHLLDTKAHAEASGNSDDGFLYARLGVVASGPAYYESVLADPEKMPLEHEFEELLYVAPNAYERKTGEELDYKTGCGYGTGSNPDGWPEESAPDPGAGDSSPETGRRSPHS